MAFRVLAAGNFPQHRTICEFRRRHLEDFERMFVEVVRVAREMGVVRFGTLSVDGTKVRANASKRKAMSYGRMLQEEARLKEEIEGLLERAGAVDGEEDERYGEEMRGDELPAELQRREKRLAAIAAAQARLEAAQRAGDDARGRTPGQGRNPKGGRPYKRARDSIQGHGAGSAHGCSLFVLLQGLSSHPSPLEWWGGLIILSLARTVWPEDAGSFRASSLSDFGVMFS